MYLYLEAPSMFSWHLLSFLGCHCIFLLHLVIETLWSYTMDAKVRDAFSVLPTHGCYSIFTLHIASIYLYICEVYVVKIFFACMYLILTRYYDCVLVYLVNGVIHYIWNNSEMCNTISLSQS